MELKINVPQIQTHTTKKVRINEKDIQAFVIGRSNRTSPNLAHPEPSCPCQQPHTYTSVKIT